MVQSSTEQQQPLLQTAAPAAPACEVSDAAVLNHARQVGLEFVHIYYMCVNKCPRDLHRFYSAASYFVHGGREPPGQHAEPPIAGQAAIAAKIGSLGFVDCRTKILMVDSLPAPASGVLIQVCGEISNNAGPMRRFMQTFLLAPIGPKKYFVQNDIFRYQDEVFTDADGAAAADLPVEAVAGDHNDAADHAPPPPPAHEEEPPLPADGDVGHVADNDDADSVIRADGGSDAADNNGVGDEELEEEVNNGPDAGVAVTSEQVEEPMTATAEEAPLADDADAAPSCVPKEATMPPPPTGGKKNFAALFGGSSQVQPQVQPQVRRQPPAAPPATTGTAQTNGSHAVEAAAVTDGRRDRDGPDNLQVFVGNLTPDVRDTDLADLFRPFGEVTATRITIGKPRQPNFGFVTFANATSVKAAVANPPTMNGGGRINVEEKKPSFRRTGGGGFGGGGRGFGGRGGGYGGPHPRR